MPNTTRPDFKTETEQVIETYLKNCDETEIDYLYRNQYDDDLYIPPIDKMYEEGDIVYKIYCYGTNLERIDKYLCRVFESEVDLQDELEILELERIHRESQY